MYAPDAARILRQFWRCDCDGASHKTRGVTGDLAVSSWCHSQAQMHLTVMEQVTRNPAPDTCPWRAFQDPIVVAVLDVMALTDGDNLAAAVTPSLPNVVYEGALHYRRARNGIERDRRLREKLARDQNGAR